MIPERTHEALKNCGIGHIGSANAVLKTIHTETFGASLDNENNCVTCFVLSILAEPILENLKEKLIIEAFWNQLIFIKFKNKIRIDKNAIEKDIINYYNSRDKKYEFNLSEIVIDVEKDVILKKKEIFKYIKEFGFRVAANKYSKSDTSKYGGEIGWIKSSRLNKKVKKKISEINIGEITEPIQTSNGYLFLKLNDKREIKEKLDLENELKQQVEFEKNRQLNQFSLNYYKKLKQNTSIYESK